MNFAKIILLGCVCYVVSILAFANSSSVLFKSCKFQSTEIDDDGKIVLFQCQKKPVTCYVQKNAKAFSDIEARLYNFKDSIKLEVHPSNGRYQDSKLLHPDCVSFEGNFIWRL